MSKRSRKAAAKKAWETRRANQRKAAAEKRRRTRQRRENERARKRSAAVKRGWETRRAKARKKKQAAAKPKGKKKGAAGAPPAPGKAEVTSADKYAQLYEQYEEYGFDFEDQGEVDGGVDY